MEVTEKAGGNSPKSEFLGIDTEGKHPEQIELEWFEKHYHGDIPQLTLRAVLMGAVLGGVMSLSNLYVGLKTGWGLGVAITACILSYSTGAALTKLGIFRSNLSILENNCMQSTASSAGYSTGATIVSAIAALLMIRGEHLPFWTLMLWTVFLAMLGVMMAIPMKRQMINVELGYRGIVSWSLWGGTAMMVTSGMLAFAMQWRTIGRAFTGLVRIIRPQAEETNGERLKAMEKIEVPGTWFVLGTTLATIGVVWIQVVSFSIHWWMGILSVVMSLFLAIVACRATGETDITPIGAMGKITQLFYGIVEPSNITTNLMTASVTAGAASSSADLLTDLKSGYLLGANPRKQFIAQFLGIFAGALVIVPAFYLIVPNPL